VTADLPVPDGVTGASQELTVVLPARLKRVPDWSGGPFPLELGSRRTDAATRAAYFAPASARALYGAPGRPCRWYQRQLVQTQESQQISGALGVLTVLGPPLGTALSILQVLGDDSVTHLLIALGLSVTATAAALTTRYGRMVLSSLRGGDRDG
jgi:hypothetical protein